MSKVRVAGFGVSLDGFGAGSEQSLTDPLGKRGTDLFQWYFHTRTFCSMVGQQGGSVGDIDDVFASRARVDRRRALASELRPTIVFPDTKLMR